MNTFEIMKLIGNAPKELLTGIETAILMRMSLFADRSGKGSRSGIVELSNKTKFCEKVVRNSLKSLIKKGIVIDRSIRKHGSHNMSSYDINVDILKETILRPSPVPHTGDSPVPHTGDKNASIKSSPVPHTASPVPHTGDSPVPHTGTPNTQLFINHDQPNNIVELVPNSTFHFSENSEIKKSKKPRKNWIDDIQLIFRHWQKEMNHPRSILDKKRNAAIKSALETGYSVEELKKAIEGVKKTAWNMRGNPSGELYDDITLIFRNSSQIERFIRNFDTEPRGIDQNVSTGQKLTFFEKNRKQVDLMNEISEKLSLKRENKLNKDTIKKGESQ